MKFQSHVPEPTKYVPVIPLRTYGSVEELLLDPWIMKWRETAGLPADFTFCWDPADDSSPSWAKAILMCQFTAESGEKKWWVLGHMSEEPEKLPRWEAPDDEF